MKLAEAKPIHLSADSQPIRRDLLDGISPENRTVLLGAIVAMAYDKSKEHEIAPYVRGFIEALVQIARAV